MNGGGPMSDNDFPKPLVTAEWLARHIGDPGLVVIDASWYLPAMNRDGADEYAKGHIPGAAFFDIDAVADHATNLPHMLPDAATFANAVGAMGADEQSRVVVYDGGGIFSAPRLWWMFRVFGHDNVAVLDGGLPAWKALGGALQADIPRPVARAFPVRENAGLVANLDDVRAALDAASAQVLDARPAARFHGRAPEPRPGLKPGHMPGGVSLPASEMLEDGRMKPVGALATAFAAAGVDLSQPVITSCGSGVSAAILTLALARMGQPLGRLYDGSWSEWGARADLPAET